MLNLAAPSQPAWLARVLADPDQLLVDHAHCEKKAASTAVNLLFRYPEHAALLVPLSQLAREELAHFEQVLRVLASRGRSFTRLTPSPYAGELLRVVRPDEPARMVDTFLCLALIEARSCERMTLLADALDDPDLAQLYRGLLASEARHHQTYVDLAMQAAPREAVRARLREIAAHEAMVLARAPAWVRMHT